MSLSEAIQEVEGWKTIDQYKDLRQVFYDKIDEIKFNKSETDYETLGVCYYYLLRIQLKTDLLYENSDCKTLYRKMINNFRKQEALYLEKLDIIKITKKAEEERFTLAQIKAFYRFVEFYLSSLEVIYSKKEFTDATTRAYKDKMYFRKRQSLFLRKPITFLGYAFWDVSCKYGTSLGRWGLTVLIFISVFATIFFFFDIAGLQETTTNVFERWHDYFYFSTVTISSLGYGDITPVTFLGKVLAEIEVILGYVMLGLFITLLQKKI